MKCIIPKQEEPVEYFLTSSISDEAIHVAVDAYPIQVVKQERCENEKPVYDDDYDDYEMEEKPVDPLEFVKQESDKETSEYEPEDVDNETDDVSCFESVSWRRCNPTLSHRIGVPR